MTEFTTESIFEALKSPLGVIDNPERRRQVEDYIEAARVPLERAVFDLLSQFGDAVNGQVAAHYQLKLGYRPGVLDLDVQASEPSDAGEETWSMAEGDVEKVTIRIPAELKDLATEAAAAASLSANSWFIRVLARSLRNVEEPPTRDRRRGRNGRLGRRLSGWVGPEE